MAVVVLSIVTIGIIHVAFLWAFKKIREGAEAHESTESDDGPEHGHGA